MRGVAGSKLTLRILAILTDVYGVMGLHFNQQTTTMTHVVGGLSEEDHCDLNNYIVRLFRVVVIVTNIVTRRTNKAQSIVIYKNTKNTSLNNIK